MDHPHELDRGLSLLRGRGPARNATLAVGSTSAAGEGSAITLLLAETLRDAFDCPVLIVERPLHAVQISSGANRSIPYSRGYDIIELLDQAESAAVLRPYLLTLSSGLQLLAETEFSTLSGSLDSVRLTQLLRKLQRFYPIMLLDCDLNAMSGAGPGSPEIEVADTVLVVASAEVPELRRAQAILRELSDSYPQAQRALVVDQVPAESLRRVQEVVSQSRTLPEAVGIYRALPMDQAIAQYRLGAALTLASLRSETRVAVKDLTLALASAWVH